MVYKLENRSINIPGKGVKKIASGKRGDVYKYRNMVLKIFSEGYNLEDIIDEESAKYLTNISTDYILLPRKILYCNDSTCGIDEYSGYSLRKLDKKGAKKRIVNESSINIINNIKALENDVVLLSKKGVLLNGVTPSNTIYNGDIFLTDPSRYSVFKEMDFDSLERLNCYQLHLLLSELIISDAKKAGFNPSIITELKDLFSIKDDYQKSSEFFEDLFVDEGNIKQFIKNL